MINYDRPNKFEMEDDGTLNLVLISGLVDNLQVIKGEMDFIFSSGDKAMGGAVAGGLAIAGLAGAATEALLSSTNTAENIETFTCRLDEKSLGGYLGKASFKNGDQVEIAAEKQSNGTYVAYAVHSRKNQKIWMGPHCTRGRKAHWRHTVKWMMILPLIIFLPNTFLCGLVKYFDGVRWDGFVFFAQINAVISLIFGLLYPIRMAKKWMPFVNKSQQIFEAFGFSDPGNVDLVKMNTAYGKARGRIKYAPWAFYYPEVDAPTK